MSPEYLETRSKRMLAFHKIQGTEPTVVFLGGFKSEMAGTKALHLEDWAKRSGRAFLRFDYSGHGVSSGVFSDGCIGDWAEDAEEILNRTTTGRFILVGSSMGGWISCLMAKRVPERIAALVTIAAAPDFTEDGFWSSFSDQQKSEVMDKGITFLPSDYGDPYPITRRLIEDGRDHLILRSPFPVDFPVRMLQGDLDQSVTRETALRLFDHMDGNDIHLSFIKGGDHSLSSPENLKVLENHLETLIAFLE